MTKTDNRSTGGRFEQELAEILANHKFWCHVMQQNKAGQPADIVAVKGHYHTLIDCKVVSDDNGFDFSRVEENQRLAMKLFQKRCSEMCYFAVKYPSGNIYMICLERILTLMGRGKKRLTEEDADKGSQAWKLTTWLAASDIWAEEI